MRSETTLKIYTASSTCPVLGVSAIPGFCFTLGGAIAIPIEPPSTEAAAGVIPSQRSRARDEIYKGFSFSEASLSQDTWSYAILDRRLLTHC
jgi:hypothetical protein